MIIAVYKPVGMTSHDVVARVRTITGEQCVGHAGTLDPLAEGVLVLGIGREATRKLWETAAGDKEYVAKIRLGATSTTDDEEGVKMPREDVVPPPREDIEHAAQKFVGEIEQVPPRYSAVKVGGREAYKYARKGRHVSLAPRRVSIKAIEALAYDWPLLTLRVTTGSGVYIRSLARDLGEELGTGGYLASLVRTRVGRFGASDARELDQISKALGVQ